MYGSTDNLLINRLEKEIEEKKDLNKQNQLLKDKIANLEATKLSDAPLINGVRYCSIIKEGANKDELFALADKIKSKCNDYLLILLGGIDNARPLLVMSGGKALNKVKANLIIKEISKVLGGGGGGRDNLATGQVKSKEGFEEITKKYQELLGGE